MGSKVSREAPETIRRPKGFIRWPKRVRTVHRIHQRPCAGSGAGAGDYRASALDRGHFQSHHQFSYRNGYWYVHS